MAKRSKNIINNRQYFVLSIYFLIVFDLLFLYLAKYLNQKLSIFEFKFFIFGNFLNFLIALIIFVGVTIIFIKKDAFYERKRSALLTFPAVITFFLLLAFFMTKINLNISSGYFLQQPVNKFVVDSVYFIFLVLQLMYLSYIWMLLIGRTEFLVIRSLVNAFILIIGFVGFAFFYSIFSMQDKYTGDENLTKADVAVVFGSAVFADNKPSPSLAKRVEKAVDLYQKGYVKKIQLTGGNAPGELSEAEVGYNVVKRFRVDLKDVTMEKKTSSTTEQVQFIKQNLVKKDKPKQIIVISDGFHLNRINEICYFNNIHPQLVPSELKLSWEKNIYYKLRESVGLIFFWLFAI